MPATVEDLVWYAMCFTITTGFPTIIKIAWNIQKLLNDILIQQAVQSEWIKDHEKVHLAIDKFIEELR